LATADLTVGRKRNIKLLGREPRHFRKINLLSVGIDVAIDPSRWAQIAGAKKFDDKGTMILRVEQHKHEPGKYLVHGMRSEVIGRVASVAAEAYDIVAAVEALPIVVARIAEHCGVSALVAELKLP
jgi:hypothetical protein